MHATRVVTFLLGAWLLGVIGMDVLLWANVRLSRTVLETAPPAVTGILNTFGAESSADLVRFYAAESDRFFLERWEVVPIILGVLLVPGMYMAADRRLIPTVMAAFMLALALFQYYSVNPELAYRTRQIDFPPGRNNTAAVQAAYGIAKVHLVTDGAEVVLGTLLSLFVLSYKSRRRTKSRRVSASEIVKREVVE